MIDLNNKIIKATKWSSITEIIAKLITPISSIVLARLLTPDAFGVVTTLSMIISFAEIFTDAGFQKYLIQHDFKDDIDKDQSTNVAFWSNLIMSLLIWLIIIIIADQLAYVVGNPGLGHVLIIACISIPLASFSSIQIALYKRSLDFKSLFKVRIIGTLIPLLVTVPLAYFLRSYWALVIGTIVTNLANVVSLTIFSKWRPRLYYSFSKFKEMFSFSAWSVLESVSVWLTSYADVFIVGLYLNQYFLGLYKTSIVVVSQIMGLITVATTPILFSALSRLQTDKLAFKTLFFKFQRVVAMFVIPLGTGIFIFSDFITKVLLGNQWIEASSFIGLWGLISSIMIVSAHYSTEVFKAKGLPKISVLAQFLHLVILVPVVLLFTPKGFTILCTARALVRLEDILVKVLLLYFVVGLSPLVMFKNILNYVLAAIVMFLTSLVCTLFFTDMMTIFSIVICGITYIMTLLCFKSERRLLFNVKKLISL